MPTTFTCAPRTGSARHAGTCRAARWITCVGSRSNSARTSSGRDTSAGTNAIRLSSSGASSAATRRSSAACVRGDDLHALVDEPAQDPRADAAVGAGDEEPLAHAATTGFWSGADAADRDLDDVAVPERDRRVAEVSDPVRRSREDHVATLERDDVRDVGDERREPEDQVAGVAVLQHRAVDGLADLDLRLERLERDDLGLDRAERVVALAPEPLPVVELEVPGAHVVGRRVAGEHPGGTLRRDAARRPRDHERELRLGVDVARLGRELDRVAGPDDRVRQLREQERGGGEHRRPPRRRARRSCGRRRRSARVGERRSCGSRRSRRRSRRRR